MPATSGSNGTTTTAAPTLAHTGTNASVLIVLGSVVTGLGLVALAASRRRRA